jgi:pfkB family carbohydrate kinase
VTATPARRVWIVGPVAWDTVAYLPSLPAPGAYTLSRRTIERAGGTAGNVAQALATTGIETGFVTGLGDDNHADRLRQALLDSGVRHLAVSRLATGTHRVLILVDDAGERTLVGLTPNGLDSIDLAAAGLEPDDVVVFVVWDDVLLDELAFATARGCTTVVGLAAVMNPAVSADLAFGSRSDLPHGPESFEDLDLSPYLTRFGRPSTPQDSPTAPKPWRQGHGGRPPPSRSRPPSRRLGLTYHSHRLRLWRERGDAEGVPSRIKENAPAWIGLVVGQARAGRKSYSDELVDCRIPVQIQVKDRGARPAGWPIALDLLRNEDPVPGPHCRGLGR